MKTCKEKALEWGLSTRAVNNLCKLGKIPGIAKVKGRWQTPSLWQNPEYGHASRLF